MKNHAYRAALAALVVASAQTASAATRIWDGGTSGISRGWNGTANWDGAAIATGDDLLIGGSPLNAGVTSFPSGGLGMHATASTLGEYTIRSVTFDNSHASAQFPVAGLNILNSSSTTPGEGRLHFNTADVNAITLQGSSPKVTFTSTTANTSHLSVDLNYTGKANFSVSSGGTLTFAGSANNSLSQPILGGTGGVTKTGAGALSLQGSGFTYAGGTTVSGGTLLLNQITLGATSGSGLLVSSGGTLRGGGTVHGASTFATGSVIDVATYADGALSASVGELTFTSNLTLGDASLFFDLDTPGASDRITLSAGGLFIGSGTLDLGNFTFNPLGGFGEGTYTLIAGTTSIVGSLGSVTTGTLGGFNTSLVLGSGGTSIDLVVTSAVPEPSACALLVGFAALAGTALRRRRAAR